MYCLATHKAVNNSLHWRHGYNMFNDRNAMIVHTLNCIQHMLHLKEIRHVVLDISHNHLYLYLFTAGYPITTELLCTENT